MEKRTIIVLAYTLSPTRGSEYSVAWNFVMRMAKYNNLIVLYGASGEHMGDCDEMEKVAAENINSSIRYVCIKPSIKTNALNWFNRNGLLNYTFYFAYNSWHRQAYKTACEIVKREKVDLIHFLNPIGYREPGYLWKIDLPYVWGPIGGVSNFPVELAPSMSKIAILKYTARSLINNYQLKHKKRLRQALSSCDVLFTATTENQEQFKKIYGKESIYLPENGIMTLETLNEDKFNISLPVELVIIGSVDSRKNLNLLFQAISRLKQKDSIRLHVIGDGPERNKLELLARNEGFADSIVWHGQIKREQLLKLISNFHLNIITSLNEGNPTVIWEAMSYGIPTLTLNHCGMRDTVCSKCGFKIDIMNYEQVVTDIADTLQQCINNPKILKEKAYSTLACAQQFLWEKREPIILDAYESVIKKHNTKR